MSYMTTVLQNSSSEAFVHLWEKHWHDKRCTIWHVPVIFFKDTCTCSACLHVIAFVKYFLHIEIFCIAQQAINEQKSISYKSIESCSISNDTFWDMGPHLLLLTIFQIKIEVFTNLCINSPVNSHWFWNHLH